MANEIQAEGRLVHSTGGLQAVLAKSKVITPAALDFQSGSQSVGTSEETIALGDIGTIGWVFVVNTDETNYVEIGSATGDYLGKMLAGESFGPVRWNAAAIYLKANTAACVVRYIVTEA